LEKQLLMKLTQFPQIVENAAQQGEPAVIAQYLFELSKKLSEFYHELPVIKANETEKIWRLNLISQTKQVLENGLNLLNINYVEQM
jgi:arginyl-tRNA synthetase